MCCAVLLLLCGVVVCGVVVVYDFLFLCLVAVIAQGMMDMMKKEPRDMTSPSPADKGSRIVDSAKEGGYFYDCPEGAGEPIIEEQQLPLCNQTEAVLNVVQYK